MDFLMMNVGMCRNVSFANWELETKIANQYFDQVDFDSAEKKYQHAKELALSLLSKGDEPERAIAALVVSFHNLADLYQKKNDLKNAHLELHSVDAYLVHYLEGGNPDSNVLNAVRLGIDKTRIELLNFVQKYKVHLLHDSLNNNIKLNH